MPAKPKKRGRSGKPKLEKDAKKKQAKNDAKKQACTFTSLPTVAQLAILRFTIGGLEGNYKDEYGLLCACILRDLRSCARVSKAWLNLTRDLTSFAAGCHTASAMRGLKTRGFSLDLTPIQNDFVLAIKNKWGHYRLDVANPMASHEGEEDEITIRPLDIIVEHFALEGDAYLDFAERVAKEYRRFLVIKSVEKASKSLQEIWAKKCHPSKLVDVMWHCHMLRPAKYARDCEQLTLEGIIDHDPDLALEGTNTLTAKLDEVYAFERLFPGDNHFGGRLSDSVQTMLFGEGFGQTFVNLALLIFGDMHGDNDCG